MDRLCVDSCFWWCWVWFWLVDVYWYLGGWFLVFGIVLVCKVFCGVFLLLVFSLLLDCKVMLVYWIVGEVDWCVGCVVVVWFLGWLVYWLWWCWDVYWDVWVLIVVDVIYVCWCNGMVVLWFSFVDVFSYKSGRLCGFDCWLLSVYRVVLCVGLGVLVFGCVMLLFCVC